MKLARITQHILFEPTDSRMLPTKWECAAPGELMLVHPEQYTVVVDVTRWIRNDHDIGGYRTMLGFRKGRTGLLLVIRGCSVADFLEYL